MAATQKLKEHEDIKKEFFNLLDEKNEELEVGFLDGTWDKYKGTMSLIDNRSSVPRTKRFMKVKYNQDLENFEYKNWLGELTSLEKEIEIGLSRF
jgi:hypothetical protein